MNDIINLLPKWFLNGYIFLIGICVGSFLNVMILRGLTGEDIVFGHSHCPKCKNNLKWYMNIPLFSYIFLKGKCAFCKCKISIQYPLIEFLNGIGYLFTFHMFGFSIKSVLFCVIISLFIALMTTDILETVIIDWHSYLFFIVCLFTVKILGGSLFSAFFAAFLIFILFEILSLASLSIIGIRCFGFGDSLMLLGISALFGIKNILFVVFLSFIIQMLLSLIPILKAKNYRLFSLMFVALFILTLNSIAFYKNFTSLKTIFAFSAVLLLGVLIFSILDIIKKTSLSETDESTEDIQTKDFIKLILRTIFVIPFLAVQFLKSDKKTAFSYFFFFPLVIYLGIYEYFLKTSAITKTLAFIDVILLLSFVFMISKNEEKVQEIFENDNKKYLPENSNEEQETNLEQEFTLLPFGPALILSSFFCVFYIDKIKIFFETVYQSYLTTIVNNL